MSEPNELFYPLDTDRIHYKRSENIWQVNSLNGPNDATFDDLAGWIIVENYSISFAIEAQSYEEAQIKTKEILIKAGRMHGPGSYQIRRLVIWEAK